MANRKTTQANRMGESLLARYMSGKRIVKHATIPSMPDAEFVWRKLTTEEEQLALAAAYQRFKKLDLPAEIKYFGDFEDECKTQVLWFAMRDPGNEGTDADPFPDKLARSCDELRSFTDPDVRELLYIDYRDFLDAVDPEETDLTDDELRAMDEALKKKELALWNSFAPSMLRRYLLILGDRPSS